MDDTGAGDHLLVYLAHGEEGVGAPVDLEVGYADGAGDEGVGGRGLVVRLTASVLTPWCWSWSSTYSPK